MPLDMLETVETAPRSATPPSSGWYDPDSSTFESVEDRPLERVAADGSVEVVTDEPELVPA